MNKYYLRVETGTETTYIPLKKVFQTIDGNFEDIRTPPGFEPNRVDELVIYDDFTEDGYVPALDGNGNPMYDSNGQPIHTGQVV